MNRLLSAVRQRTQFKLRQRQWRPYKATKLDVLDFIHLKEAVTVYDLVDRFEYSYKGAKQRLWLLHRGKLIQPLFQRGTWGLTELGFQRLDYYKKL